jgi:hypothetical protein
MIAEKDKALYASNIHATSWTTPHKYGYNNDDINYHGKKAINYRLGDGTDGNGNPDANNHLKKVIQ